MEGRSNLFVAAAVAALGCATVWIPGCSSGTPVFPEEIHASWEYVSFICPDMQGTLRVEGDGSLSIEGAGGETPDLGVLSPETWRSLLRATEAAELPDVGGFLTSPRGVGLVRVREAEHVRGFYWDSELLLSEAQKRLVALLRLIRSEAASPEDERLPRIPVATLLQGSVSALIEPWEVVARDEEALLHILDVAFPGESVVIPSVDFGKEMVAGLFVGAAAAPADIEIWSQAGWTLSGDLRLAVALGVAAGDCPKTRSPYQLVRLPKSPCEVYFLRNRVTLPCTGMQAGSPWVSSLRGTRSVAGGQAVLPTESMEDVGSTR